MKHPFNPLLQRARTKTLHSICSGVSESENEVAGRIRFLAKFKKPKALALGGIVLMLGCVAAFCLGGDNPIVTLPQSTSDATTGTQISQSDTPTNANSSSEEATPPTQAELLAFAQENYPQILPDGNIDLLEDVSEYQGMSSQEVIGFGSEHYTYLFSAEAGEIFFVFLQEESYQAPTATSISSSQQALAAATDYLTGFCLGEISPEYQETMVERIGTEIYSVTFTWATQEGILTGQRASIYLREDGTLESLVYHAPEVLSPTLDLSEMITEEEAIALAYAALEDVTPDDADQITTSQAIENGSVQWEITIANVVNDALTMALGEAYTQTFWVKIDAFTGETMQVDFSR